MTIRVERKTTLTLTGTSVTVGELAEVLKEFPARATIRFQYHKGYDQRDHEYITISVEMPAPIKLSGSTPIYPPGTR